MIGPEGEPWNLITKPHFLFILGSWPGDCDHLLCALATRHPCHNRLYLLLIKEPRRAFLTQLLWVGCLVTAAARVTNKLLGCSKHRIHITSLPSQGSTEVGKPLPALADKCLLTRTSRNNGSQSQGVDWEPGMTNKEDRSNVWDQGVLQKLVTNAKWVIIILCFQEKQPKSAESHISVGTENIGFLHTDNHSLREESVPQKWQPWLLQGTWFQCQRGPDKSVSGQEHRTKVPFVLSSGPLRKCWVGLYPHGLQFNIILLPHWLF